MAIPKLLPKLRGNQTERKPLQLTNEFLTSSAFLQDPRFLSLPVAFGLDVALVMALAAGREADEELGQAALVKIQLQRNNRPPGPVDRLGEFRQFAL